MQNNRTEKDTEPLDLLIKGALVVDGSNLLYSPSSITTTVS